MLNEFFFLPIRIGACIRKEAGTGVKGKVSYIFLYLAVTFLLFAALDGVQVWYVGDALYYVNTYLFLGMMYVFFTWRKA